VQAAYKDVTYNRILPPGSPANDVTVDVFESSKQPGDAQVAQHMVLVEPMRGQLTVAEAYIFRNDGKVTYNDMDGGTLRFFVPPAANGAMKVEATAPQGMPIPQAADKTSTPNVYQVAFPIKPGETRIDVSYNLPFTPPGTFEGKILYRGGPTRLVAPNGVTLKGDSIQPLGQEPRTKASIYDVKGASFKVEISGAASAQTAEGGSDDSSGPSFEQIPPRVYRNMKWILVLAFAILTLGFILLSRARVPEAIQGAATAKSSAKEKNERRRR
jgi:hypothetical protein